MAKIKIYRDSPGVSMFKIVLGSALGALGVGFGFLLWNKRQAELGRSAILALLPQIQWNQRPVVTLPK